MEQHLHQVETKLEEYLRIADTTVQNNLIRQAKNNIAEARVWLAQARLTR